MKDGRATTVPRKQQPKGLYIYLPAYLYLSNFISMHIRTYDTYVRMRTDASISIKIIEGNTKTRKSFVFCTPHRGVPFLSIMPGSFLLPAATCSPKLPHVAEKLCLARRRGSEGSFGQTMALLVKSNRTCGARVGNSFPFV